VKKWIQMDQQQALQTIIQILIDNGISPEQAEQLAHYKLYKYLCKVVLLQLKHLQIN
jgi:hypothetical protein